MIYVHLFTVFAMIRRLNLINPVKKVGNYAPREETSTAISPFYLTDSQQNFTIFYLRASEQPTTNATLVKIEILRLFFDPQFPLRVPLSRHFAPSPIANRL